MERQTRPVILVAAIASQDPLMAAQVRRKQGGLTGVSEAVGLLGRGARGRTGRALFCTATAISLEVRFGPLISGRMIPFLICSMEHSRYRH